LKVEIEVEVEVEVEIEIEVEKDRCWSNNYVLVMLKASDDVRQQADEIAAATTALSC
jgi:hypothetical protein